MGEGEGTGNMWGGGAEYARALLVCYYKNFQSSRFWDIKRGERQRASSGRICESSRRVSERGEDRKEMNPGNVRMMNER